MEKDLNMTNYWKLYHEVYPENHSKELNEQRRICALELLNNTEQLLTWIAADFVKTGNVPDFISIDQNSEYGQGGKYRWGQNTGQYFDNLDEFTKCALETKKIEVRDYNPEKDRFDIDINKYDLIKVYEGYPLALACKTCIDNSNPCGDRPLRIDIYPSGDFKKQLYAEYIDEQQKEIDKQMVHISELQERISKASKQITSIAGR